MLKFQYYEKPVSLFYYGMCANPHLLKVLQYMRVVETVCFFGVDPPPEVYSKFLLRCCTAPIVLVVERSPSFTTQRKDDLRKTKNEVGAQG